MLTVEEDNHEHSVFSAEIKMNSRLHMKIGSKSKEDAWSVGESKVTIRDAPDGLNTAERSFGGYGLSPFARIKIFWVLILYRALLKPEYEVLIK